MNTPIRRLSVVVLLMFVALLAQVTLVQYGRADSLNNKEFNTRSIYREYGRDRGPIVVAGNEIASSEPVDDAFGFQRTYTDGPTYAPITGYFSVVFQSSGMEKAANEVLNGSDTSLLLSRIRTLFTGGQQRGGAVELTIDPAVQEAGLSAFGNQRGAAVAIEPATGKILGLISTPSFDPNALAGHDTAEVNEAYQELTADPGRPLVNRAIGGDQYPPGSTFKLIDLAMILESGDYGPDSVVPAPTELDLPGTTATIHNPGGAACGSGGEATLRYSLQVSCNTPFANLAMEMGTDALREQAEAFGFGQDLSVPLKVSGSRFGEPENDAQLAMTAIGQFDVRTTPMQMAMVAAAIANDGTLMTPYLVQTERGPDLRVTRSAEPSEFSQPISAKTAATMTEMMVGVVDDGTGYPAQISGVDVAGKTGTAQTGNEEHQHAWFTAFAPADDPQIAVAVVVENGGDLAGEATGSKVAAPIARAMIQAVISE